MSRSGSKYAPTRSKTLEKLKGFASLPHNWHYGKGGPIDQDVLIKTEDMYYLMVSLGMTKTNVFAGQDGEVLLSAYKGDDYIGVIIEPTLTASVTHEKGDNTQYYMEFGSILEARSAVRSLVGKICNISVRSTPKTSILTVESSMTWSSRSLPIAECLSSKGSAQKRQAGLCVNI
jgi:hypothetical protein